MRRRSFLGLVAGAAASGLLGRRASAAPPPSGVSKIKDVTTEAGGTTLRLELASAPFPVASAGYQDSSVYVFVPDAFRPERPVQSEPDVENGEEGGERRLSRPEVPMIVHFHGHRTTAERALAAHELREQLVDSRQNAILVVPQGPVMAADSSCGKLEAPGGLTRLLDEVLATLAHEAASALGPAGISRNAQVGTVCLSAHSGGYHAAAACVKAGGVEINEVYLFDALYGDADSFRDWVVAGKGRRLRARHKLVSYYASPATQAQNQWLLGELTKAGVACAVEEVEGTLSREQFSRGEAVFVRTELPHGDVTHELNALRDCLYASGMRRHVRTAWFDHKTETRPLERRR